MKVNKRYCWAMYWQRHGPDMPATHGRLSCPSKKKAIAAAMEHPGPYEHATVSHPKTHETVFEYGNPSCFDAKSWTPQDREIRIADSIRALKEDGA